MYFVLIFHYDGGATGAYIGDAMRNARGKLRAYGSTAGAVPGEDSGVFRSAGVWRNSRPLSNGTLEEGDFDIDMSRVVPTANEFRSASLSANICISY